MGLFTDRKTDFPTLTSTSEILPFPILGEASPSLMWAILGSTTPPVQLEREAKKTVLGASSLLARPNKERMPTAEGGSQKKGELGGYQEPRREIEVKTVPSVRFRFLSHETRHL